MHTHYACMSIFMYVSWPRVRGRLCISDRCVNMRARIRTHTHTWYNVHKNTRTRTHVPARLPARPPTHTHIRARARANTYTHGLHVRTEMGVGQRAVMTTNTHTTPSAVVRGGGLDLFPGTEARCWGGVRGEMMMPLCFC